MTRDEKITFIIDCIWEIEEAAVGASYFEDYTDEQLDKEVIWYEYLLTK